MGSWKHWKAVPEKGHSLMRHAMIDLETLSTTSRAAVRQIGWATFDPDAREDGVLASGCIWLEVQPQLDRGHRMDFDTVCWWLQQSQGARDRMSQPPVLPRMPSEGLASLDDAIGWSSISGVWSHGATFDLPILTNLYATAGRKEPWGYKAARDTRTLFDLAGPSLVWASNEVLHSAEHDAVAQAITVQRALRIVRRIL
jgi:hypothetical protein